MRNAESKMRKTKCRGWQILGWFWLLSCLCLNNVFAQQPRAPAPPPGVAEPARPSSSRSGSITGRVLSDDGIPAASVTVFASTISAGQPTGRPVTTDAEGNFVFRDLPARSHRIFASSPGYVAGNDPFESTAYHLGDNVTLNLVKGGVITGRVLNSVGEPVIAVNMSVIRVRDAEGKSVQGISGSGRTVQTDDLGIYRIYGLRAGSYLVVANGGGFTTSRGTPYDGDAPVFYPSSTRDAATEVQVTADNVTSGIDLRYRAEPGHIISGKISSAGEISSGNVIPAASLTLRQSGTGVVVANSYISLMSSSSGYEMRGVPDGEYEIGASRFDRTNGAASPWKRVLVRGADVPGVELVLSPLATLAGRVVFEPTAPNANPAEKCTPKRQAALEEVLLRLQRDEANDNLFANLGSSESAPDEKGAFTLPNVQTGRYRLLATPPNEAWYVKAIGTGAAPAASAATTGRRPATASAANSANLFSFKAGDKLSGVTVTLAEGAATLQGQVISSNVKTATRLRVHLVPADPAAAEDVLRYYEMPLRNDGTFNFKQLAPGKYWLLARPIPDDESYERPARPLAWEQTERLKLRRDAEVAKQEIELTACQRVNELKVKFQGR